MRDAVERMPATMLIAGPKCGGFTKLEVTPGGGGLVGSNVGEGVAGIFSHRQR